MSTNVNKNWHLSAEARWILFELRDAIQYNLQLDELGNSGDFTGHRGLLPLIYQAFIKIWCHKIKCCVRKESYSPATLLDKPMVLVPVDVYEVFRSAYFRETGSHSPGFPLKNGTLFPAMVDAIPGSNVDDLPF